MADALIVYLRQTLPSEVATLAEPYIARLERGEYEAILQDDDARALVGLDNDSKTEDIKPEDFPTWNDYIFHRLGVLLADRRRPEKQSVFFCMGYAALLAFLQSNVTGPPLAFSPAQSLFTPAVAADQHKLQNVRTGLLESLGMDGIAAYKLTPNIELLCLADAIFTCPPILKNIAAARWAKLRVAFLQQRLLSEVSPFLQDVIYEDLRLLQDPIFNDEINATVGIQEEFALERATIHIHHGLDKLAREDLDRVRRQRQFEFALVGRLGKRTKFQQTDISQLVVLAKSNAEDTNGAPRLNGSESQPGKSPALDVTATTAQAQPENIDLNDETLLESISFTKAPADDFAKVVAEDALPPNLASLDPSAQPQLQPLDSTILLALASSITNTSPAHGLTREETLPYATRVLEGGSSNWQIYTQALLVRSRLEGYRSRTVERGLLQLQALVDQVIADTTGATTSPTNGDDSTAQSATFLPRPQQSESASASERLRYIFQLASPYRWDLEGELAARWVQLGGLRSALDIYERLEMWAEAALCWAATEREDRARNIVRKQLFHATDSKAEHTVDESETWSGPARQPPPTDAPRLYCILGDLDHSPEMYEKAWEVSNQRYARAQRSLGRFYFAAKDFAKAAQAYRLSLKASQLNHPSWFALGCAYLELADFSQAAEAFSRCVQLDENDAEAWSNLAAALLRKGKDIQVNKVAQTPTEAKLDDEDESVHHSAEQTNTVQQQQEQHKQDALKALKRAATLKHDSHRIWENALIVAASLSPPDYATVLTAQKRLLDLRGSTEGEKCIDVEILEHLVRYVIALSDTYDPAQPGVQRMTVKFMDESVVPVITGSAELWRLVVEATVRLCDSYESLGPRERTEGMGAGEELVARDWRFKARSAVRGILGRGKGSFEGSEGWERLRGVMEDLKG
ncbi:hypothetical protein BDY17DRAFT_257137 [Neohortaea acidophila]|uniref:Uncharacterized protein n=1 Tax=Neohortaea acidophila TaxID=245834 RepID=A0A6A6PHE0_9PEZI|nr:uncharacterized protein BDY17DRAFT_257137 [Neohortaea acidophila]KAF2479419.1 hypothetical protein BDY17DRAFT_257137 [Neohortaea acidophila]